MRALIVLLPLVLAACLGSRGEAFAEGVACEPVGEAENPPPLLIGGLEGVARGAEAATSGSGRVRARVVVSERGRGEAATVEEHTGPAPDSVLTGLLERTAWQPGSARGRAVRWACTVSFAYGD